MTKMIVDLGGVGHRDGIISINIHEVMEPNIVDDITASADRLSKIFQPNTVDEFYCIHTLEHLPEDQYVPSLRYWLKFLKPGGSLTVVVPDIAGIMKDYAEKKIDVQIALSIIYTRGAPYGSHKWGWSPVTLYTDMHRAGYAGIDIATSERPFWIYNFEEFKENRAFGDYQVPNVRLIGYKP